MRRKKNQSRFMTIGEILFPLLKKRGMAYKLEENELLKLWPKAVGAQIALQTKADAFKNGTLFVKTISSVWVQQLHFMKEDIRHKLNEISGKNSVKEIRFLAGYILAPFRNDADKSSKANSFLKERDKKMIADCTAAFADRELAAIFQRVMQGEINRRRQRESEQVRGR